MQLGERYARLLELAREQSSDKRRELLSDVTSLFFSNTENRSDIETNMFGELLTKVASDLDVETRKELSNRFCTEKAPRRLIVSLAHDPEVSVAGPVLMHSTALTQDDLISLVEKRGDPHRMLVTKRTDVSEALSRALVSFGGDRVVESLVQNVTASICHDTFDKIVERSQNNATLQSSLVGRKSISAEHLNRLFLSVGPALREQILARNQDYSEEEINTAIERAQTRVAVSHGVLPADFEAASRDIGSLQSRNALEATMLPNFWRDNKKTHFILAFALLSGLDYHQVDKLFANTDIDGIAMVSRASGFPRGLFVTIAVLASGEQGMNSAKTLGDMYNEVPEEAAQRAIRFMKLRAGVTAKAA